MHFTNVIDTDRRRACATAYSSARFLAERSRLSTDQTHKKQFKHNPEHGRV